jgi:thiol-disulfide isomerase/thioredoxin
MPLSSPFTRRRFLSCTGVLSMAAALPARADALQRGDVVRWPAVTLLDGTTLPAAHWMDRAAVVVFWSVGCPFCRRHNPHVEKLHRAAAARRLQVLGVSTDRDPAAVRRHVAEQGFSFPNTMDYALLAPLFVQRRMIPLTATVNRQGRFVQTIPGEMFEDDVLELLPRLTA